jgi:hypothetical protein
MCAFFLTDCTHASGICSYPVSSSRSSHHKAERTDYRSCRSVFVDREENGSIRRRYPSIHVAIRQQYSFSPPNYVTSDELAAQSLAFTQRDIKDEAEDFLSSLIGRPKEEEDEKPRFSPDVGEGMNNNFTWDVEAKTTRFQTTTSLQRSCWRCSEHFHRGWIPPTSPTKTIP